MKLSLKQGKLRLKGMLLTNNVEVHVMMLHNKNLGLWFLRRDFKIFTFKIYHRSRDTKLQWTETIFNNFGSNIPWTFLSPWPSGFREDVF